MYEIFPDGGRVLSQEHYCRALLRAMCCACFHPTALCEQIESLLVLHDMNDFIYVALLETLFTINLIF